MSTPATPWKSTTDVIIPHPELPQVLLLAGEAGWQLPGVSIEYDDSYQLSQITQALEDRLGIATLALRHLGGHEDEEQRQEYQIYLLENRSPLWCPPEGARWTGRTDLRDLTLADPGQRAAIDAWLDEQEHGVLPAGRVPWALPGWFDTASAWIAQQLAQRGTPLAGPVEQIQNWPLSCVLRARTADGMFYFKAAAQLPLFGPEPAIMARLAEWYPDHVPAPVCQDDQQWWMLLRDFGPAVGNDAALAAHERLIQDFGALQRGCVPHLDDLLAAGCLDRRLEHLPGQLDALLRDRSVLNRLEESEIARFQALQPRLAAMCTQLADYPIPQTIIHGDLHLGNVALHAGRYLFFDWTDAAISHPFFDMFVIHGESEPAKQAHLRDLYLASWTDYAPIATLQEAWVLAGPLTRLHHAISYQYIVNSVEESARGHFIDVAPGLVRRILEILAPE